MAYQLCGRAWRGLVVIGGLLSSLACSRSGLLTNSLETDEGLSRNRGAAGGVGAKSTVTTSIPPQVTSPSGSSTTPIEPMAPFVPQVSPSNSSRRWVSVPTEDKENSAQLFAIRLGQSTVEDLIRVDPTDLPHKHVWGAFSQNGRGLAVTVEGAGQDRVASRLWDFGAPRPTVLEVAATSNSSSTYFGPWIGEHRIITCDLGVLPAMGTNCRILDLDHPSEVSFFGDFGIAGASSMGYFEVSPSQKWLCAFAEIEGGSRALLVAQVLDVGLGTWSKVLDVPIDQAPAVVVFSNDDRYFAQVNVVLATGLLANSISIVRLDNPPVRLPGLRVRAEDYLNYVMWAPNSSRFFAHTTRVLSNGRGVNPIIVADAEMGQSGEVTSAYFPSSSPGFTSAGRGVLTYPYSDETGNHGMEWLEVSEPPSAPSPVTLRGVNGMAVRGGQLDPNGTGFFGISGPSARDFPDAKGPIDLDVFDFSNGFGGPAVVTRLSELANVDTWQFAPSGKSLVYRVVVPTDATTASDLLTQSRYTAELGTYWAGTAVGGTQRLGLDWTSYHSVMWLPDDSGLLRRGPASYPMVVPAAGTTNGQGVTVVEPSALQLLTWHRFDGGPGVSLDLTAFLGQGYHLSPYEWPSVAKRWIDQN